jgi:hypothetical protein
MNNGPEYDLKLLSSLSLRRFIMAWKNPEAAAIQMEAYAAQAALHGQMSMSLDELGSLYQMLNSLPWWQKAHQENSPHYYEGKQGEKALAYQAHQLALLEKLLNMGLKSCYEQWKELPEGEEKELLSHPPNGEFLFCWDEIEDPSGYDPDAEEHSYPEDFDYDYS